MNGDDSFLRRLDGSGVPLLIVRLALAVAFIYMGSLKIADPVEFLKQIRMYRVLPESPPIYLNATAVILPWMEVVAGTALLLGLQMRGAAAMVAIMLCVFTPAILSRALQVQAETGKPFVAIEFDCGCGTGVVIVWKKLLANVGLAALSLIALLSRSTRFCPGAWLARRWVGLGAS